MEYKFQPTGSSMHRYLTQEQRERILDKYDPDDIIDILSLTSEELIELLEKLIYENIELFELETIEDGSRY